MIWIVLAVMTAAVIAALVRPVVKTGSRPAAQDRNAYDRAIFRDQLAELDRDVERGTIGATEAEAARNEISRRLISAAGAAPRARPLGTPFLALLAALIIPAIALPLYLRAGSPTLPDVPLAARLQNAAATGDLDALIAKVEQHLAENPDDLQGWKVLAPTYVRAQRWSDAAEAQRNILRLSQPTATGLADYGEALVLANRGTVSADAHKLFGEALKLDPKLPKARYYDALALKQEAKTADARAAFEAFLADTPSDAPWRDMLLAEMQDIGKPPPGPDQKTIEAAANMSPQDRQNMIRSMVDGLEEKLNTNGNDLDGWLRLIRARSVLGEAGKAKSAYDKAAGQFKNDPKALAALDGLARELNIP